jgi:hypothetical protein
MGFYRVYEPNLAISSLFATNHYNLTFSRSFNQNSYNSRLFTTEFPILQFAVIILIGVGSNDLICTQVLKGLGFRHYFTNRNLENHYMQSAAENKTMMDNG